MVKKRILSIALAMLLLMSVVPAFAAQSDEDTSVYSRGVKSVDATISLSGKTISCSGDASVVSGNYHLTLTMTLQKKNGKAWNPIDTWTASGKTSASINKSKAGLSSGTYRCAVVARAYDKNDTLIEAVTAYSSTKTI